MTHLISKNAHIPAKLYTGREVMRDKLWIERGRERENRR